MGSNTGERMRIALVILGMAPDFVRHAGCPDEIEGHSFVRTLATQYMLNWS